MAVAFPALQTSFPHSSRADLSWVLNAHNIVFGALLIPGGRAADRWGRRRVFGVGLLVFTAGSLACGLAPTVPWLIAGRIVQGAGSALVAPASLGLLLAAFPVAQRATAVTIWGGIASLGAALGPTLGASIVVASQWRWVFFVYVPIALATAALSHLLLAESSEPESGRIPDWVGVVMLSVALAALPPGTVEARDWGCGGPPQLPGGLAAVDSPARARNWNLFSGSERGLGLRPPQHSFRSRRGGQPGGPPARGGAGGGGRGGRDRQRHLRPGAELLHRLVPG